MRRELRRLGARLENTERRLRLAHPGVRLNQQVQRLDDLALRLSGAMYGRLHRRHVRLADVRAAGALLTRHTVCEHSAGQQLHAPRTCARTSPARARRWRSRASGGVATSSRGFAIVTDARGAVDTAHRVRR